MKSRLLLAALAAAATIALIAGCGGSSSSGHDLASLAPPKTPVFVEGTLRPEGELKSNVDAIAEKIGGVENLGDLIVEELEKQAKEEGEPFDFEKEVEPWLGERGAVFFEQLEGENFTGTGAIVESTDTEAAQEFIDKHGKHEEGRKVGLVGDFLVIAEDQKVFKEIEEASEGESLGGEDTFTKAISAASNGSLADVYVDVGALIKQNGGQINPTARGLLQNAGIDPSEATAVASVVPGAEQVAVELSSNLGGEEAPTGDASKLLGELPGDAFAGFAVSGFGEQLTEAIDSLDEEGIEGTVPPHQLKKGLKEIGIDLEGVAGSLEDAAVFASGTGKNNLGGALVLSTKGSQATKAVENIGLLLRQVHVQGVTALGGKYKRLLDPQRRTRQQAARRRRHGRPSGDRLRPGADGRRADQRQRQRQDAFRGPRLRSRGQRPRRHADRRLRRRRRRPAPRRSARPRLKRRLRQGEEVPEEHRVPRARQRQPGRTGDGQADRRPEVASATHRCGGLG